MLFSLEKDTGDSVVGYVVPDSFVAVPTIRICAGGRELLVMEASEVRNSLVAGGRHETGRCGFSVTTRALPNLRDIEDLEISDAETGVLIYRRPPPGAIRKKILRLETHLFPLWAFDEALRASFQYFAKGIENLGSETVTQMFLLLKVNSVYLSGRILYKSYAYYIEAGFETLLIIQDPYEELAERLFVLSKLRRFGGEQLGLRDSIGMSAAMSFAEELMADEATLADEKALRRVLRRMPQPVAATLSNPLVRELTAATPDDMPGRNAIASALDLLSRVAVLGLRSESDIFVAAVAEFLGVATAALPPLPRFGKVPVLAESLKRTGAVDLILEKDLEVYHHVREACRKVAPASFGDVVRPGPPGSP